MIAAPEVNGKLLHRKMMDIFKDRKVLTISQFQEDAGL